MISIKKAILNSAKVLFESTGYKKTKIADIMLHAQMATGTFYNYFESKEEIFMVLFMDENVRLKEQIIKETDLSANPTVVMTSMMQLNEQGMRANPILREWYNRDLFAKMESNYRNRNGLERMQFMYEHFIKLIKQWQNDNIMHSDIEAQEIMAIFNALIIMETHKEEVGIDEP